MYYYPRGIIILYSDKADKSYRISGFGEYNISYSCNGNACAGGTFAESSMSGQDSAWLKTVSGTTTVICLKTGSDHIVPIDLFYTTGTGIVWRVRNLYSSTATGTLVVRVIRTTYYPS